MDPTKTPHSDTEDDTSRRPEIPPLMARELVRILGPDAVRLGPDAEPTDPYGAPGDDSHMSAGVVWPSSTDDVRAIVRLAGQHDVPLWTHGRGRNLGFGGTSPVVRASVRVDLARMDRILTIDEELAYAVVEPGVRWSDLYDAVQAAGLDLMTPTPDLGWGSIVGNTMDAGITYQRYGADHGLAAGLEVVLPDGDLLRTGMGAMEGNEAWHLVRRGHGPDLAGIFAQSNYGIVTRMGVWLQRRPEAYVPLMLSIGSDGDLARAVDTIRELRLTGALEGVPALYRGVGAAVMLRDAPTPDPRRTLGLRDVHRIVGDADVGGWAVRTGIGGPRVLVEARLGLVREAWARIPTGRVVASGPLAADEHDRLRFSSERICAGIPGLTTYENMPDHVGHVAFSAVVPLRGETMRVLFEEVRALGAREGVIPTFGVLVVSERASIAVIGMQYDRMDAAAVRGALDFVRVLITELGERGYGEYRSHVDTMDLAAERFGFNDHAHRRVAERIKDALDPHGILAPGRYGVWPRAYRTVEEHDSCMQFQGHIAGISAESAS